MTSRCTTILPLVARVSATSQLCRSARPAILEQLAKSSSQTPGLGGGLEKGGGSGGTIRESGIFGEREAAFEEKYFRELSARQLENLHEYHAEEIRHIEKDIKDSEATLKKQKEKLDHLKKLMKNLMWTNSGGCLCLDYKYVETADKDSVVKAKVAAQLYS